MKDMTKGSIPKLIIMFALPIFLSNLFQQMYNAFDSLIVGRYIGDAALAAVSSSGNLIFLFTSFFIGTASGASVLISKYYGEKDYDSMSKAIHTNVAVGIIFGIILTIVGVFLSPFILKLMKTDPNVLPNSIEYFQCYFWGAMGIVLYNIFSSILNAVGNSKRTLIYLVIASITNVLLDILFIIGFKWGVGSAGVASAISQVFSALLCFMYLHRKGQIYTIRIRDIKIHKDMLKLIIKYGIPAGVQNSVIALANVFVQSNINSFGDIAMGGCGTYSKIEGFAFLPITSFTMALTTFISQNLGAKEYDRAKKGATFGTICACSLAELIGIIMFLFMPFLASMFTTNEEIIKVATYQARVITLFYFLLAYSHSIAAVCRGQGRTMIPMLVMLVIWCILRVTYITIAINIKHDIVLLFIAYPLTWFISSVIYFIYLRRYNWERGFN